MSLRILIIDDHVAVQRGLQEILSGSFKTAEFGQASNVHDALNTVQKTPWDVAVVDLNMPGRGGLELIKTAKEMQPKLRVLVYSMHSEKHFGLRALKAGADGYLMKDSPAEEIVKAVRGLVDAGQYISPELAAAMAQSVRGDGTDTDRLSDREYEVLQKIASGKCPSEIAEEMALSIKTVSTYRARLLEKLNLRTTAELIRYAIEQGVCR
jgi:DNA-binding NarL/FixJ family response regulator